MFDHTVKRVGKGKRKERKTQKEMWKLQQEQEVTKSKAEKQQRQKVHKQEDTQKHERKQNKTKVTLWWTSKQLQRQCAF